MKLTLNALALLASTLLAPLASIAQQGPARQASPQQKALVKRAGQTLRQRGGNGAPIGTPTALTSFDIDLNSVRLGTPGTVSRQLYDANTQAFAVDVLAAVTYDGNGRPYDVVLTDSITGATEGRLHYRYNAAGLMTSYEVEDHLGPADPIRPVYREETGYDAQGFVVRSEEFDYDPSGSRWILREGSRYSVTYDAQNRPFVVIDSSFNELTGTYHLMGKIDYHYTGTATAPDKILNYDTTGGGLNYALSVENIRWIDHARGWFEYADVVVPIPGAGNLIAGRYEGTATATTYTETISMIDLTDPTSLSPYARFTHEYNDEGDQSLFRSEATDDDGLTWNLMGENSNVYEYNRPNGEISAKTEWTYNPTTGQSEPQTRFLYQGSGATGVKGAKPAVRMAPNPATGHVALQGPARASGRLVNAAGATVATFRLGTDGTARLSLQDLAPGLYSVQVTGLQTARLAIQ